MFKLSSKALATIDEKYSESVKNLDGQSWQINANRCGCSGDCGSNWMRS